MTEPAHAAHAAHTTSRTRTARRARHPLLQILIMLTVLLALTAAVVTWLHRDPGPTGPLSAAGYQQQLIRVCAQTRPAFDAAISQPATPTTTTEFVAPYVQLRVYVTKLSKGLENLEPQGDLRARHQAYLAALAGLEDQLTALIDAQDKNAPFTPDAAAAQKETVLASMDRAGKAFTALGLDGTGCVEL